jgi:aspartate dehydrogenase
MIGKARAAPPRIVLIGYGAIADEVIRSLEARGEISALVGILVRPERLPQFRQKALGRFAVVDGLAALLDLAPDIVIEAAGHDAVARYGADVLGRASIC